MPNLKNVVAKKLVYKGDPSNRILLILLKNAQVSNPTAQEIRIRESSIRKASLDEAANFIIAIANVMGD